MEKLNKVIAGLECCLDEDRSCRDSCPYFKGSYELDGCMDDLMAAALDVLWKNVYRDRENSQKNVKADWYERLSDLDYNYNPVKDGKPWYRADDVWACIEEVPK